MRRTCETRHQLTSLLSSVQTSLAELKDEVASARKLSYEPASKSNVKSSRCPTSFPSIGKGLICCRLSLHTGPNMISASNLKLVSSKSHDELFAMYRLSSPVSQAPVKGCGRQIATNTPLQRSASVHAVDAWTHSPHAASPTIPAHGDIATSCPARTAAHSLPPPVPLQAHMGL